VKKQIIIWSIVTTVVMETVTLVLRFGFELESTRDTASTIGQLTMGLRIHHSYIGVVFLLLSLVVSRPNFRVPLIVLGCGLFWSDVIHHFLVLWPITGSPEFHLVYPDTPR